MSPNTDRQTPGRAEAGLAHPAGTQPPTAPPPPAPGGGADTSPPHQAGQTAAQPFRTARPPIVPEPHRTAESHPTNPMPLTHADPRSHLAYRPPAIHTGHGRGGATVPQTAHAAGNRKNRMPAPNHPPAGLNGAPRPPSYR
ncbi:hypothetical protein GCM10023107_37810 [Actinoplanes octamycinicus]|nr:hypothetical protein Aoc01nite_31010 [Actinoplanes octamycinicus]